MNRMLNGLNATVTRNDCLRSIAPNGPIEYSHGVWVSNTYWNV